MPEPHFQASDPAVGRKKDLSPEERRGWETAAKKASFSRVPLWMNFLDLNPIQRIVLGRVYSFQCTYGDDGDHVYHMSLSRGAAELNFCDRAKLKKILDLLVKDGYLIKLKTSPQATARYKVDEALCLMKAVDNGYEVKAWR